MFVDTSGLFSILAPDQPHHFTAKELILRKKNRLLHSSILVELVALSQARRTPRGKRLSFIASILSNPDFVVIWLDHSDFSEALQLLQARPDKHYSLCDAASFILMRRMNIREALTTDHHFEHEGFIRLLK